MQAVTHEQAVQSRFARTTREGKRIWRSLYFGPPPSAPSTSSLMPDNTGAVYVEPAAGEPRPAQAFLIEQEPGATVQPHFHYVDQFQVAAAGGGLLGRHPIAPLSVHYSAPCTGYGPIEPGEQGLSYFTLRADADQTGAQYLPAAKHLMRPGPRRNVIVSQIASSAPDALRTRSESVVDIRHDDPDGLAVILYRIAPNQTLNCMEPAQGRGIMLLVSAGCLQLKGLDYPRWSCAFIAVDDAPPSLQAGPEGAEVLAMRYPKHPS